MCSIYNSQEMKAIKYPLTDEWIKMWYIYLTYITEYYSAIKKTEIMPYAAT